jgi:thiol-disulfide isomerase/thioredoxin
MQWVRLVFGAALLLLVVGAGVYVVVYNRAIPAGEDAPTLELTDVMFPTEAGEQVSLDDIDARIRVINFWASWSPSSGEELASLKKLEEAYPKDIKVIAINRDTTKEEGFAFLDAQGLKGRLLYLYDSADTYYKKLGGYNMPETVFININDEVLARVRGPMTYTMMEETARTLLER